MKAAYIQQFGGPEVLQVGEVLVTAYCEVDRNPPTFLTERSVNCGVRPTAAN